MRLSRMARRPGLAAAALVLALLVPAAPSLADEVTTLSGSGAGLNPVGDREDAAGETVTFAPSLAGTIVLAASC